MLQQDASLAIRRWLVAMNLPPRTPPNPSTDGQKPKPPAARRPLFPGWVWWVLFALLVLWNVFTFFAPSGETTVSLTYTDFLAQVRAGNVQTAKISGQQATGGLKNAIPQPGPTPAASPTASPTPPPTSKSYSTVLPAQDDPALMPLLEEKGVQVTNVDVSGGSWVLTLITSALPILLLVGLLLYLGRQMQQGQQAALGFGRSRARLYGAERPRVTFADVAGEDEAKTELTEVVDFLKKPDRYYAVGARLPRGVLLVGPPGTGKTLLARAIAGEAQVPFYSISASEFVELFVGVGASRVRDLFEQAKRNAPSIVFVDELDAVGRQRGAGLGGGNDEREQTLNQLLVEMDGFDEREQVIVVAATNRPDVLDPALLRPGRFDRQVTLGLPDRNGRMQILKVHIRGKPLANDVDLEQLARATPGFSGADLANLVNEAALLTARDDRHELVPADFELALDKIILGVERPHLVSLEERKVVAYHEAGHALVALCTEGADPVKKVTIIPRGQTIGVTEQVPLNDRLNYSLTYLQGRLVVMLGGRTAEEVVFHEPTTGAENDLQEATKLARRMVTNWGMVDSIGPIYYGGEGASEILLGRDLIQKRDVAEQTAAKLDEAVSKLIGEAHEQATRIVASRRDQLDRIVAQLLEHETISGDEVRRIVGDSGDGIARL
jgi:cell division protease FtsH